MRKLFTSMVAVFAATTMSAQAPSDWQANQDVTDELEWMNPLYQGDNAGWVNNGAGVGYFYDTAKCATGSVEMYNNALGAEYYQIFWLPAGYYEFSVQGFYRPGSAWAAGWDTNTDQNGIFFCNAVDEVEKETEDGGIEVEYVTTKENQTNLMLIVDPRGAYQGSDKILTDDMCGDWQRDNGFTKDGNQWWVPNSMWGTSLYFDMGAYKNTLMVVNPTDGFVKLGIRKSPDTIDQDWIIFNNFRAKYISDAGEALQLMLAQEKIADAKAKIEDFCSEIDATYGALSGLISDDVMNYEAENADYDATIENSEATAAYYKNLLAEYNEYLKDAKKLTILINKCITLNNKLGDATFADAIATAKAIESDGNEADLTIETGAAYGDAFVTLNAARVTALKALPSVNDAWDFSLMINNPWFCNEEYNPTYNAEEGRWYFPDYVLNGDGEKLGYRDYAEGNATYNGADNHIIIADQFKIGTKEVEGAWYQVGTSAYEPYWNHQYSSAKQWATPGNNREIVQIITDLPNGYYSAKGLGMTWGNDWDKSETDPEKTCHMGVYIESSNGKSVSTQAPIYSGWWQGWHPFDWNQYTTNIIRVTDGTAKVAFFANGFSSFTGMQLYYYGETPNFMAMIKSEIDAVNAIELTLEGDKAKVAELLAAVPETIDSFEAFDAAEAAIKAASEYATNASKYLASWTVADAFMNLQSTLDETSAEYAILDPTWDYALSYFDEPTATYLGAIAIENDYKAYAKYIETRATMNAVADQNDELKSMLADQAGVLSAQYATAETIYGYLSDLARPYNAATIAALGGNNASESNPIDITVLLTNPEFNNGNAGWDGEFATSNDFKNAESYSTASFTASQTVFALPAGAYRVQVQSFYRDGGDAKTAFMNAVYNDSYTPNVQLFANKNATDIMSLGECEFLEPSMTERITEWVRDDEATNEYHLTQNEEEDYDPNKVIYTPKYEYMDMENPAYPFDQMVDDYELLWFPNSMEGSMNCFAKHPEAYINTVEVYLEDTDNITLGVKKAHSAIGGDWCIFDNFKLFYLGKDVPTGIADANADAAASAIYSVSGIRQNALQRGINIIKMSDGTAKKVIK